MEGSHKSWRPLTVLSFRLNHLTGGLRPRGFHATNVLLHALVTTLFLCWSRRVLPRGPAPIIAALVFAVHPVHCEAVAGLVGRAELGCTVFLLLALLSHGAHVQARDTCRPRHATALLALTVVLAASASLCKEQGLVTLVLCVACDVIYCAKPRDILRSPKLQTMRSSICTLASASLVFVAVRLAVMGGKLPTFVLADNPAAHSTSFVTRSLTFLYLPVFNFGLFLCPSILSFDWSMDSIPLVDSWADSRNLLSAAFYVVLGVMVWRHGRPLLMGGRGARDVILSVVMADVPFLPASNLLGYVGFVAAERVLYTPSLGLSMLLGLGAARLWRRPQAPRVLLACLLTLLLACLATKTWRRNVDWSTEEALYRSGVAVNPAKGKST